nr:hypothetical protein [Sphingomonas sp. Leaf33]
MQNAKDANLPARRAIENDVWRARDTPLAIAARRNRTGHRRSRKKTGGTNDPLGQLVGNVDVILTMILVDRGKISEG